MAFIVTADMTEHQPGTHEKTVKDLEAMRVKFREWYELTDASVDMPLFLTDDSPVLLVDIAKKVHEDRRLKTSEDEAA